MYLAEEMRGGAFESDLGFAHNLVMTYGYVLARTAQARQGISILD
jgi:hypothetical protein